MAKSGQVYDQKKFITGYGYSVNGTKFTLQSIGIILRIGRIPPGIYFTFFSHALAPSKKSKKPDLSKTGLVGLDFRTLFTSLRPYLCSPPILVLNLVSLPLRCSHLSSGKRRLLLAVDDRNIFGRNKSYFGDINCNCPNVSLFGEERHGNENGYSWSFIVLFWQLIGILTMAHPLSSWATRNKVN